MKYLLIAAGIFALTFPATAFGQTSSAQQADQKVEKMTFKGDDINGTPLGPDNEAIRIPSHGPVSSLMQSRQNFLPELVKSEQEL